MAPVRVVAAVVTRNRRELLAESLPAVIRQTRAPDRVIVVDNASTDGTGAMLAERFPAVDVVALPRNEGATGGFHAAIATGLSRGADWLWLLDDDCFPHPTALAELLGALDRVDGRPAPAVLSSRVEWRDGRPHLMNRPIVRVADTGELARALRAGLLPLRAASWVSLLVSRAAVERAGMPLRRFFYQADDIEYTARILRRGRGYFVPTSVVEHRTPGQHTALDDEHRFFHHLRNTLFMIRGDAWDLREKPNLAWLVVFTSAQYLVRGRLSPRRAWTVLRALAAGLFSPAR